MNRGISDFRLLLIADCSCRNQNNPKSKIQNPKSGMTLIEVMLAMIILSTALVALLSAASQCLAVARKAKLYDTARMLMGRVELENPLLLKEKIEEEEEEPTAFEDGSEGFTWSRKVEKVGSDEEHEGLFKVTTRIQWSERGVDTYEEVATYWYSPKPVVGGVVESR